MEAVAFHVLLVQILLLNDSTAESMAECFTTRGQLYCINQGYEYWNSLLSIFNCDERLNPTLPFAPV